MAGTIDSESSGDKPAGFLFDKDGATQEGAAVFEFVLGWEEAKARVFGELLVGFFVDGSGDIGGGQCE